MPLPSTLVGRVTSPREVPVDARWMMAYAAGLGETAACYFDTVAGIVPHPVFPVCLEWDPILDMRFGPGTETMSVVEQARAVHADHDLHLLSPLRAGERYTTTCTAIAVEQRSPGAYLLKRIDTRDAQGKVVCRTFQGTLYRGVAIDGAPASIDSAPSCPTAESGTSISRPIAIAANAAHVYTECARIWNPIHTDRAHALAAGLPDIILHGTATLALAVSAIVDARLDGDPTRVVRLGGRFSGMVLMPSSLQVVIVGEDAHTVVFEVSNAEAGSVIRRGFVGLRE